MNLAMQGLMATPKSNNPDLDFVVMMISHHADAIDMASQAAVDSNDPKVVLFSQHIINAQIEQISAYKAWLREKAARSRR